MNIPRLGWARRGTLLQRISLHCLAELVPEYDCAILPIAPERRISFHSRRSLGFYGWDG